MSDFWKRLERFSTRPEVSDQGRVTRRSIWDEMRKPEKQDETFFDAEGNEVKAPQVETTELSQEDQELFDMTEAGIERLSLDEGERFTMYKDSEGIPTIGVGFNLKIPSNQRLFKKIVGFSAKEALEGREITKLQSRQLLQKSLEIASADAEGVFRPVWEKLNDEQRDALTNFLFNLGKTRALGFKRAVKALNAGDGEEAAKEMLDSKWARQVGKRANRIADVVRRIDLTEASRGGVDIPDNFVEVDLPD